MYTCCASGVKRRPRYCFAGTRRRQAYREYLVNNRDLKQTANIFQSLLLCRYAASAGIQKISASVLVSSGIAPVNRHVVQPYRNRQTVVFAFFYENLFRCIPVVVGHGALITHETLVVLIHNTPFSTRSTCVTTSRTLLRGYLDESVVTSKQPIRTRYLGHVTGYQPIRDQFFLIRSVPATYPVLSGTTGITARRGDVLGVLELEPASKQPIRTRYIGHVTGYSQSGTSISWICGRSRAVVISARALLSRGDPGPRIAMWDLVDGWRVCFSAVLVL
eukprot:sb/3468018/